MMLPKHFAGGVLNLSIIYLHTHSEWYENNKTWFLESIYWNYNGRSMIALNVFQLCFRLSLQNKQTHSMDYVFIIPSEWTGLNRMVLMEDSGFLSDGRLGSWIDVLVTDWER
jgi:hypothetical protein